MKTGIFISRLQPRHRGHEQCIKEMASRVDQPIILIGSANASRSPKNPWLFHERKADLQKWLFQEKINALIVPINDYRYNDGAWINEVRSAVDHFAKGGSVTLFKHMKDGNDYLTWFPDWKSHDFPAFANNISATELREWMYRTNDPKLPKPVYADIAYYKAEAAKFANYPYPETLNFNCGDAVVECAGHILLVERKHTPGAGTWALPGGFKNRNESFLDCVIRELREETQLKVPEKVLLGSIVGKELFDSPTRSFGINRNTLAVHFRIALNPDGTLPQVKGTDDAKAAEWFPIHQALNHMYLFDDHADIISKLTGVVPAMAYTI